MRKAKKDYYAKIIKENKDNIKETWKILNQIINKQKIHHTLPKTFKDPKDNKTIKTDTNIAKGFNKFFVNVGPNLAKKIPNTKINDSVTIDIQNSLYLVETTEDEIKKIVKTTKDKKSEDLNGLSMNTVKQII